MDKRTKEFLSRLGQQIPKKMLEQAVQKEKTHNSEEAIERFAYSQPKQEREKIMQDMKEGKYASKERYTAGKEGSRELDKWMETKVKKAIDSNEIEKPKDDAFTKMVKEKMSNV